MHKYCFAFAHKNGQPFCRCLSEVVCDRADSRCSFFKTKRQYDVDLVVCNGTNDLMKIGKTYAETHVDNLEGEYKNVQ